MQKSVYKPRNSDMGTFADAIIDFIRIRQLNIAVAFLLTGVYLFYQYWDVLTKNEGPCRHERLSRSRSRSHGSRSRSRSYYRPQSDSKHRRGRKLHRRCPDCSLCDFGH